MKNRNADGKKNLEIRVPFWEQLLEYFDSKNYKLYEKTNRETVGHSYLSARSDVSVCRYYLAFLKKEARVELLLCGSNEDNKKVLDYLCKRKKEIEKAFGNKLEIKEPEEKREGGIRGKRGKIYFAKEFDGWNCDNWPEMIKWLYEHMRKLEKAIKPMIPDIRNIVK